MNDNVEGRTYLGISKESLSIEVTTHCNSACGHCFVRAGKSEHCSLSNDLVKEIIAEGYYTGYRHLHVTGGEPLLWEGLFETLDYAFSLGYKRILLNTNGTLLTEDFIHGFFSYDGFSISVSLDGPESCHDRSRGKGSFKRTVQGIEKALYSGIDLSIFTVVSKSLLPKLPHFADDLFRRFSDINYLTLIQLIKVKDHVFDLSNELLDPDDFLQLVRMVPLLNIYGKTEILNNPLSTVASKLLEIHWSPKSIPLHRAGHLVVMASGDITLSHSTRDSFGKYKPGKIEKVLSSSQYRTGVAPDETTCPSCKYYKLCTKNGMVRPSEWYRDTYPDVPYCKRVLSRAALCI